MSDGTSRAARSPRRSVFIAASGNFLEMYDFMVFGYFAREIGAAFFPTGDEWSSVLLALMTFGAGFLMRPIGAIVLGAYMERHGRRRGLMLSLLLMGVGTLTIGCAPGYDSLGLAAPIVILVARLLQGLSAGVEVGGVSVYLSEIAKPGQRGFYVAWQSASQQLAVVCAAAIGLAASALLSPGDMAGWGWRIAFIIGALMLPFLLIVRSYLDESPVFAAQRMRPDLATVLATLRANSGIVLRGVLMTMMTTVFFYMLTAYTPTYGRSVLELPATTAMLATLAVGAANFVLLPTMGALSDRVGRQPLLIVASMLGALTAYPALEWLVGAPSFSRLLVVQLWFATIYATYNGAMIVHMTEMMPPSVRTAGFSLAYSTATAIFGGFTPALATWLIRETGNRAAPALWMSTAASISLVTVLVSIRRRARGSVVASPE